MFNIAINKSQLDNLEKLATFLEVVPARIDKANDRAASVAVFKIEQNLKRRGKPGRFVKVSYKRYGSFGLKIRFETRGGRGGMYGGGRSTNYSPLWASRIFLHSEQGMTGRRAFVLPRKERGSYSDKSGRARTYTKRYRFSHTSGEWKEGTQKLGPLKIPAIGPFYFSAKSGMPREDIKKTGRKIILNELNKSYKKEFSKMMRG